VEVAAQSSAERQRDIDGGLENRTANNDLGCHPQRINFRIMLFVLVF